MRPRVRVLGAMNRYREANVAAPPKVLRTKPRYGPKLREARFEDYDQIAGLESRFGLTAKPYEEWVHLWQLRAPSLSASQVLARRRGR